MQFLSPKSNKLVIVAALIMCAGSLSDAAAQRSRSRAAAPQVGFANNESALRIPFELGPKNHIFVQVRLNNSEPLWFILDTGASTLIGLNRAQSLGLKLSGGEQGFGGGEEGVNVLTAAAATLSLPGVTIREQNVAVIPIDNLAAGLNHPVDGLLGASFFRRFVVEIDYAAHTMSLSVPRSYRYRGRGERIAIRQEDEQIFVRARVKPISLAPVNGWFLIDTGGGHALILNSSFVKTHNLLTPEQQAHPAHAESIGGAARVVPGTVESLQIGRSNITRPQTLFSLAAQGTTATAGIAGNIGGGVLSHFKVIFDYSRGQMILVSGQ